MSEGGKHPAAFEVPPSRKKMGPMSYGGVVWKGKGR